MSVSRALMAAMWAMSSFVSTGFERRLISSTTATTPLDAALQAHGAGAGGDVLQALGDDGLGEHDAVVVPSPAMSLVLAATSSSSWAPMFS